VEHANWFHLCAFSTEDVLKMSVKRRKCIKHDEDANDLEEAGVKLEVFKNYR